MAVREWWRYDTPGAVQNREAGEWERTVRSQMFRRATRTDGGEDFDAAVRRRLDEDARNPLTEDLRRRDRAFEALRAPVEPIETPPLEEDRPLRPHERILAEAGQAGRQMLQRFRERFAGGGGGGGSWGGEEERPLRPHERAAQLLYDKMPVGSTGASARTLVEDVLPQLDRPRGAAFSAVERMGLTGSGDPREAAIARALPGGVGAGLLGLRGAISPSEYQGADLLTRARGGRGVLSDEDTLPLGLSARDVAGGVADVLLDPVDLVGGGALGAVDLARGGARLARGAGGAARRALTPDLTVTADDIAEMQRAARGEPSLRRLAFDETAGAKQPPKMPETRSMAIDVIDTRPELFQARDVVEGQATDPRRVRKIVEQFEPNRFDPIVVARLPGSEGRHVVISGHHRLEAARELGSADVPVRVMEGDLTTEAGRKKLQNEAALGNFTQAENNVREAYRSFRVLEQNGMDPRAIAQQVRSGFGTEAKVQSILDMGALGDSALERVVANDQFAPAAAEIGSLIRRHGVAREDAFALFEQVTRKAAETGSVPSQAAIRASVDKYAGRLADMRVSQGQMAGFEPSAFMSAIAEEMDLRSTIIKERNDFKRSVNAVRKLGGQLGMEGQADELARQGEARMAALTARLTNIQEEIAGRFEGIERATPTPEPRALPRAATPSPERPAAPPTAGLSPSQQLLYKADEAGVKLTSRERQVLLSGTDEELIGIIRNRVEGVAEPAVADEAVDVVEERASQRRARLRRRAAERPPAPEPEAPRDVVAAAMARGPEPVAPRAEAPRAEVPVPERLLGVNDLLAQIRRGENIEGARNQLETRFAMDADEIDSRVAFPDQEGPGLFDVAPPRAAPASSAPPPGQSDLAGFSTAPERQPDATPAMQGDLGMGAGERPVEALPMFGGALEGAPRLFGEAPVEARATLPAPAPASPPSSPARAARLVDDLAERGVREEGFTREMELPGQRGVTERVEPPSSRAAQQSQFIVAEEAAAAAPLPTPSTPSLTPEGRYARVRTPLWDAPAVGEPSGDILPWVTRPEGAGGGGGAQPPAPPSLPSGRQPGGPHNIPATPTQPRRIGAVREREWRTDAHSKRGPEHKPKYVMDLADQTPEARRGFVTNQHDPVARAEHYYAQQGQRELAPGQRDALLQAQAMDQPGNGRGHFLRSLVTPARNMPKHVWQSWVASGNTEADVLTRVFSWEDQTLAAARRLFGGTDRVDVRYIGPAMREQAVRRAGGMVEVEAVPAERFLMNARGQSLTGTFKDLVDNPELYDLTEAQKNWLRDFNLGNLEVSDALRTDYNVEIGDFMPPSARPGDLEAGRVGFLPNIQANTDVVEALSGQLDVGLGSSGHLKERTFGSAAARGAYDPDFIPETDLQRLFVGLNRAKARAAGNEVFRAGVGGSVEDIQGLTRGATGSHLALEDAQAVTKLAKNFDANSVPGRIVRAISAINQAVLSGDLSMLTIQGVLGFLASPVESARIIAGGARRALREGNLGRPFSLETLARDIAEDSSWADFAQFRGIPLASDVPEEFAGGYLRRIPGYSRLNEAGYIAVTRLQKGLWDRMARDLVDSGRLSLDEARAVAMETVTGFIPTLTTKQLGMSSARAQWERAPFTSISFLRRPAAFAETATRGLMKMGTLQQVTPAEQLAAKLALQMAGTAIGASLATGAADALMRGEDAEQRVKDLLNPLSGEFLTVYAPGTGWKAPIGGPFRALIKAIVPKPMDVGGVTVPVPFAGLPRYAQGRIQPTLARGLELRANKDYQGDPIMTGDFPLNIVQGAMHMAAGVIPLPAAAPLEAARKGESFERGVARTGGGVLGLNPIPPGFAEEKRRAQDELARSAKLPNQLTGKGVAGTWEELTPQQRIEARNLRPELAKKLQDVQDRIDARFDPEGRKTRDDAEAERVAGEAELGARLRRGELSLTQFAEAIEDVQSKAAILKAHSYKDAEFPESADPNEQALRGWYDLYRMAEYPGGMDYDKLDSLQADFMRGLDAEQRKFVEGRAEASHHPSVQWYYDNKRVIRESGYYDTSAKLYETLKTRLAEQSRAPLPATYGEAQRQVLRYQSARDVQAAAQLRAVLDLVDKAADRQKIALRATNPGLELALRENRGLQPVQASFGGGGSSRSRSRGYSGGYTLSRRTTSRAR